MPPKFKFTREEIIEAAVELTREGGPSALTARALAARLGCSVKPVFGLFENMEEVQNQVLLAANARYHEYLKEDMERGVYPPYKASGMAYIRFAKEEKELFKLLFMRDRSGEDITDLENDSGDIIRIIMKNTGLEKEEAKLFHLEMWVYVHGIATMVATSYLDWDTEFISRVLTDAYIGMKYRYCGEEETKDGSN